jgi:hypothetical protein
MASFDGLLMLGLYWVVVALAGWALVDALFRPRAAYVAAGKLNKPAWGAITGLALVIAYFSAPLTFLWLPAVVDRLPGRRPPRGARSQARQEQLVSTR